MLPSGPTAMPPFGFCNCAWSARPPSPVRPETPVPASVLIVPPGRNDAHAVVQRIGDVDGVVRPERDVLGALESRQGRGTAVAAESRDAGAGDGADDAVGLDPPDAIEAGSDVEAAVAADCKPA